MPEQQYLTCMELAKASNLELMNVSDDCWTPDTSFANVIEVAIKR